VFLALTRVLAVSVLSVLAAPLQVIIAFVVGAGFGILEHAVTYSSEDQWSQFWRIMFHGGATALSMLMWLVLEPLPDRRARWLAIVPSFFWHYFNNGLAVVLMFGAIFSLGNTAWLEVASLIISIFAVAAIYASMLIVMVAQSAVRLRAARSVRRRFPPLPPRWRITPAATAGGQPVLREPRAPALLSGDGMPPRWR
jgi:hypothetical protein